MLYPPNQVPAEYGKEFINNPTRVRRVLESRTRDMNIADFAFAPSQANNGGVVYDRVTASSTQDRLQRQAEVRAPGAEFTKIGVTDAEPERAIVKEYGAETPITWKAIQRGDTREINRRLNYLADAVIQKIDRVSVAAIHSDPDIEEYLVDTAWSSSSADPLGDLIMGRGKAEDHDHAEMRYKIDTILINPEDLRQYFWANQDIRKELTRASETPSPIVNPYFQDYLDMSWVPTTEVARGTTFMLQRGVSGALGDEDNGIQTHTYDIDSRHVKAYQAWRTVVPFITDPSSIVRVTGFGS